MQDLYIKRIHLRICLAGTWINSMIITSEAGWYKTNSNILNMDPLWSYHVVLLKSSWLMGYLLISNPGSFVPLANRIAPYFPFLTFYSSAFIFSYPSKRNPKFVIMIAVFSLFTVVSMSSLELIHWLSTS